MASSVESIQSRRLPVYLLIDTSGSMNGAAIDAVSVGISTMISQLKRDPHALETVHLSVITFDSDARQIIPLTEIASFKEPVFAPQGSTALGAGLRTLVKCVEKDVHKGDASQKGDWKPMVFLMTDGVPTDNWEAAIPEVKKKSWGQFVACGAGPGAETEPLKKITEVVYKLHEVADMKAFFNWVTASVKMSSVAIQTAPANPNGAQAPMPPAPPQMTIIP